MSNLMTTLGIDYKVRTPERVEATMPVDERTCQPFGILHGGATLALAETVAGVGSLENVPQGTHVVGMNVCANHISSAKVGDTVRATATPVHIGRQTHIWQVDVRSEEDKRIISSVRVTNFIHFPKE